MITLHATTTVVDVDVPLFSISSVKEKIPQNVIDLIQLIGGMMIWALFFMYIIHSATSGLWSGMGFSTVDDNIVDRAPDVDVFTVDPDSGDLVMEEGQYSEDVEYL
jgi:hypothetical protein